MLRHHAYLHIELYEVLRLMVLKNNRRLAHAGGMRKSLRYPLENLCVSINAHHLISIFSPNGHHLVTICWGGKRMSEPLFGLCVGMWGTLIGTWISQFF